MSTTTGPQQTTSIKHKIMGVASLCSKRRLEASSSSNSDSDYATTPKIAKRSPCHRSYESNEHTELLIAGTGTDKCSSEFLTTSILARTLLTSSAPCHNGILGSGTSPLESLKSSLEALPAPTFLESIEELHNGSSFLPKLSTNRSSIDELEFNSLLCHERSTITILSPIDEVLDSAVDWAEDGLSSILKSSNHPTSVIIDQVITEDENGKSYINLGTTETTILARKSSRGSSGNSFLTHNSPIDQTWTTSGNNLDYLDDSSSSSSCESLSSEDLFNSCEEFDEASEDEEEIRTYKQQRSTVLHLSLCKLNSFRTQQCVEPSLHRSVLICNTLRHIEQEIRHEDEAKKNDCSTPPSSNFLQNRGPLPPFWQSNSRNGHGQGTTSSSNGSGHAQLSVLSQGTTTNNNSSQDPYLSTSIYSDLPYSPSAVTSSAVVYDYNSPHRPSPTPFHTTSYDYPEVDLSLTSGQSADILTGLVSSPSPSLLECDSGYAEDLDLSMSYYYQTPSPTSSTDFPNNQQSGGGVVNGILSGDGGNTSCYMPSCSVESTTTAPNPNSYGANQSGVILGTESLPPFLIPKDSFLSMVPALESSKISHHKCTNSQIKSSIPTNMSEETTTRFGDESSHWSKFTSSAVFAQHENNQCGMESLRSEFCNGDNTNILNGSSLNLTHHQLPMDSLISSNYS